MESTTTVGLRKLIDGQCGHAWKVGHTLNYSPGVVNLHSYHEFKIMITITMIITMKRKFLGQNGGDGGEYLL